MSTLHIYNVPLNLVSLRPRPPRPSISAQPVLVFRSYHPIEIIRFQSIIGFELWFGGKIERILIYETVLRIYMVCLMSVAVKTHAIEVEVCCGVLL